MAVENLDNLQSEKEVQTPLREWVCSNIQNNVKETLQETLVKKVQDSLEQQSKWNRNIETSTTKLWSTSISILPKGMEKKSCSPINIIIWLEWWININIQHPSYYEDFYYLWENLSPEDCFSYTNKFDEILQWQPCEEVLPNSKLKKISLDPNDWM